MPAARRYAATLGLERLMLMSLALVLSFGACQDPDSATGPSPAPRALSVATSTTLTASRDGYVTSKHPNRNGGWKDSMDVAQPLRSLVGFDQAAIAAAVGTGTLTNATLRLTIGRTTENWGPTGRTIDVHRLTVPWTEAGETYNCAIDSSPNNTTKECSGATEWAMASTTSPPWASPRTAQAMVTTGMTGTVDFDVTADVIAFLGGTPNEGWLLKKTDEDKQGRIVFLTKEGGAAPALVLTVDAEVPDTTRPVVPASRKLSTVADTTLVATPPGDTVTIAYRNVFRVRFDDSTSGTTIRAFLVEMQGEIISGNPNAGEYIIRFPDPGASYQAVDSLQRAIMSRVGVDYAVPSKWRSGAALYGRYPGDGPGAQRSDWLGAPTNFTRPRLQIRAPLAWGCEMGAYGGPRVAVGVVDFFFNRALPDFAGMLASPSEPGPSGRDMKPSTVSRDHGSEVASIMVGDGDDSAGIAGMMWNAELSLFALTANGQQPVDLTEYFVEEVLPLATSRGVRVLVMSMTLGTSDSADVRSLELAISKFTAAGGLLVKAAGNYSVYRTVEQLLQTTNSDYLGTEMAVARLMQGSPQARAGLLLVAGTDENGEFWQGGSFYSGITEILAPAVQVGTLDFNGALHSVPSGNSLAAPFVGGVAGLLLAMDPTLTASELKDYIIRGASVYREDSATGDSMPAPNPGAPDANVRQLDAYGSLKLLSYERPGTPLCGLSITNTGNAWYQTQSIIQRQGGPELVEVAGQPVAFTSVAQGGRLAAGGTETYRLTGGQWVGAGGDGVHAVVFLEQDTAYLRPETTTGNLWSRTDLWLRLGSADPDRRVSDTNVTASFPANLGGAQLHWQWAGYTPELVSVSPTGDWIYVEFTWGFNDDCLSRPNQSGEYRRLIPLRGGQSVALSSREETVLSCTGDPWPTSVTSTAAAGGRVAWRGDGQDFYYGREYYDAETRLERWTVVGGVQEIGTGPTVGVLAFDALVWSAEAGRLLSRERYLSYDPPGDCLERIRASADPATIAQSVRVGDYYTSCPDVPLAAVKLAPGPGARPTPGKPATTPINRRYPLGIPATMRVN